MVEDVRYYSEGDIQSVLVLQVESYFHQKCTEEYSSDTSRWLKAGHWSRTTADLLTKQQREFECGTEVLGHFVLSVVP